MKKLAYLILLTCFLLSILLSACKKEIDIGVRFLTQKPWKVVKHEEMNTLDIYVETTGNYDVCELDNIYTFKGPGSGYGTYEIREGATKCDPSAPDLYFTSYYYMNPPYNTVITMDTAVVYFIERLSNDTLILVDNNQRPYKRATFTH